MAMFKVCWGDEKDLPKTYHSGYAYFVKDKGLLYIDTTDEEGGRICLNAAGANGLIVDGEIVESDQFVRISDMIDVEHGGTGKTTLTLNALLLGNGTDAVKELEVPTDNFIIGSENGVVAATAEKIRTLLQVNTVQEIDNKIKNATTVAYEATLDVESWVPGDGESTYTYENEQLKCGKNGDVPPLITFSDNQEEYSKIESAEATKGQGIVFHIKETPQNPISIIIIDQM